MCQVVRLYEVLGAEQLRWLVPLIHANAEAMKLVAKYGVPGVVALYETSTDGHLNVAAAG